ncbi:iron ABC transporter permease [Microcella alkalica]
MFNPAAPAVTRPPRVGRQRADKKSILLGVLVCLLVGALTVTPVIYVIIGSFNSQSLGQGFSFSLEGWSRLFASSATLESIWYSFVFAVRIPIALVIAFGIAWLLVRTDLPGRKFIETSLWVAFFLPALPVTIGWVLLANEDYGLLNSVVQMMLPWVEEGPFAINSVIGILWVHLTMSTIPIMVILLSPAFEQFDASFEEAAESSGARVGTTLRKVTLPLLAPAVFTAFIAGLIKSLEVFEVEQILGTPVGIGVYANRIFELVRLDPPAYMDAMAIGTLFLIVLLVAAIVYQIVLHKMQAQATLTGRGLRMNRKLRTRSLYVASALIITFISVGVFLPILTLLVGSFNKIFGFFFISSPWTTSHWERVLANPDFLSAAGNSMVIGIVASTLGTLLFALLAWLLVRSRMRGKAILNILVWMPWAIPGVLMSIAVLRIFLTVPGPNLLYGTLAPLIIVLIIKEMPLGTQMLRTAIMQVAPELEEGGQVSGARFRQVFFKITLPLIAPMLVTVFMLTFVTTLRDVGSVVFLAPPGTKNLPILMFEYANGGAMESGAVLGVIIAALALVLVSVAMRLGLRMNPHRDTRKARK